MSDHKSKATRLVNYWNGINHPVILELVTELRHLDSVNRELLEALRIIIDNNDDLFFYEIARAAIAKATRNN